MQQVVLAGEPPIEILVRRTAAARRISLRVSRLDGRVTLTLPPRTSEREALAFAHEKAGWIRRNISQGSAAVPVKLEQEIPFHGVACRIVTTTGRSVRHEAGQILVPGDPDRAGVRVAAFLKLQARNTLAAACDDYAARIGRPYTSLSLRDTRSRWGSCNSAGRLMFSWRLIMAPTDVLQYVAAHEVAHLAEMNHSPRFWAVVNDLFPGYEVQRRWLRSHGPALHAVRFDN